GGADRPVAVLVVAEELGEARVGVDARQAEPVDRSGARDQRYRRRVADEPVVFEGSTHGREGRGPRRRGNLRGAAGGWRGTGNRAFTGATAPRGESVCRSIRAGSTASSSGASTSRATPCGWG